MGITDCADGGVGILGEAAFGIGAKEGEGFFLAKLMPEVFETDRRAVETSGPHDGDHLAKGPDAAFAAAGARQKIANQ